MSRRHSLTRDEIVAAMLDYCAGAGGTGLSVTSQLRRRRKQRHNAHDHPNFALCGLRLFGSAAHADTHANANQGRNQNANAHADAAMFAGYVRVDLHTEYEQRVLPNRANAAYVAPVQRARRLYHP